MDEEKATGIALRIRDEFEDMLTETGVTIPSVDREGVPGEARLYGEENTRLEEAIVGLLIEQAGSITLSSDVDDASHPVLELAIQICDEFEEILAEKDIKIHSNDRSGDPEEACLFGSEYYAIEDAVVGILMEELGAATTPEQAGAISYEARTAVATKQKAMTTAPESLTTVGPVKMREHDALARPEPRRGATAPLK